MNLSAEQQTSWSFREAEGQLAESVFIAFDMQTQELLTGSKILQGLDNSGHYTQEILLVDRTGESHPIHCRATRLQDSANRSAGAVLIFSDLSERWALESELDHLASHDSLTNLLNRREFERRLTRVIDQSFDESVNHAVLFLDLDRFQLINGTCGNIAGDAFLQQIAKLLKSGVRSGDSIARLSGDQFGVLLEDCTAEQANQIGEKLLKLVRDFRFIWKSKKYGTGVSIGFVIIQRGANNAATVLRHAESACYLAKNTGRNRIRVFSENDELLNQRHGEMQWVDRIEHALENNEFVLYSQAIEPASLGKSSQIHFEVLLRMREKNGGIISPSQFLPAAERYNLITRIDRWVVGHTFEWLANNPKIVSSLELCSINLSGQSLGDPTFLTFITEQFDLYELPTSCICFEVTETAAIANLSAAMVLMNTLRLKGCSFALDDFGSGLSSFAYLKSLPVNYLKIDGMFVKDILENSLDYAMVRSINEIGQTMNMQTIAEYVESDGIRAQLQSIGVDFVQGYGVGKPQPLENTMYRSKLEAV
jgi:diguanylate cyclase (GGDEF)-like protein